MHPCLEINEILSEIARHAPGQVDLSAMTLVCKAFYEPAMAQLWYTVYDISQLLAAMPEGIISHMLYEDSGSDDEPYECWVSVDAEAITTNELTSVVHRVSNVPLQQKNGLTSRDTRNVSESSVGESCTVNISIRTLVCHS